MNISRATLYRYHLPLARSLVIKNQKHTYRQGMLLRLDNADGRSGWGEIAPLPGFSKESLDDAQSQMTGILPALREVMTDGHSPADLTFEPLDELELHSSVRCGCEMALLHLAAEQAGISIMRILGGSATSLALNGLLAGMTDDMLTHADTCATQGYRTVKLKLGGRSLDEDVAMVYRIYARIAGKAHLRLDANRAWTVEQAVQFGKSVDACPIEYVEEPLRDPGKLDELGRQWRLPIALDETLAEMSPHEIPEIAGLRAFVIKPTLVGGLKRAAAFAKCAQEKGLRGVISSSFESSVGLTVLAHLAAALAPDIPAGLDTSEWFEESLMEQPMPRTGGTLRIRSEITLEAAVRQQALTEVTHA